ncbi:MAG TPA: hypothetical protein VFU21_02010 [Kofleriaceae bacterium]|nr:hypothetical protein [Kofleriaceae bacterium]
MGQVLVFEAPRRIAVSDEEVAAPAAGEVLVRTLYSGISAGTELTAYRGTNPYLIKTWDPERRLFTGGGSAERPSYPLVGWGYEEVGQMVEQTTHMFDLARMFLGEAASVHALTTRVPRTGHPECDVDEVSVAQVRFASGAVASFASTHILAASHTVGLHLYAENLAVEIAAGGIAVDRGEGREQIDTPGDATAATARRLPRRGPPPGPDRRPLELRGRPRDPPAHHHRARIGPRRPGAACRQAVTRRVLR